MEGAICYTYKLGNPIDIQQLAKTRTDLKKVDINTLEKEYDYLIVQILGNGEVRVLAKDKTIKTLNKAIVTTIVQIRSLISDINEKLGIGINVDEVIKNGGIDTLTSQRITETVLRTTYGGTASVMPLRLLSIYSQEVIGEFHSKRAMTGAGELLGRSWVQERKIETKEELLNMIKTKLHENRFGLIEFYEPEKTTDETEIIARLSESAFSSGMPPIGRQVDNFIRGILRGAISEFKQIENISVKEVKCWGLGETYCEFKIIIHPI